MSAADSSSADGVSVDSHSTVLTAASSNWSLGASTPLSLPLLARADDTSTEAVLSVFDADPLFAALAKKEMEAILVRDDEDASKLADGIAMAVAKGVLPAKPAAAKVTKVHVHGKPADAVAAEICAAVGDAAAGGCILTLQGLSGTGKGTTVAKLQALLPRAVCWSNGNVFRALTLLAVTYCEKHGLPLCAEALTPSLIGELMRCLTFGKFHGEFDIRICGQGFDLLVSEVANTALKEPRVGKNIPTVAKMTQGEVINFAADAADAMRADGMNVLMEGRAQTLAYVRTPHRFELVLSSPLLIGKRRAAQRLVCGALNRLKTAEGTEAGVSTQLVLDSLQAELAEMAVSER
ncbi:hypothetical protein AB1Y20_000553 [Prymnesium parvum]|mmetsp:Transcript_8866/g.19630  ORF Transcript_8866/g.19630 Transcript_8866/m.19630 type:complete len:350 (-) Transcript_8866:514-1563(-)